MAEMIPPQGQVSVVMAGVLNWLWAGAGYFIVGQKTKGIVFCLVTLAVLIMTIITCGIGLVIWMPYVIVLIIDAVLIAQRVNRGETIGEWQFF